jgi:hypothetical protein
VFLSTPTTPSLEYLCQSQSRRLFSLHYSSTSHACPLHSSAPAVNETHVAAYLQYLDIAAARHVAHPRVGAAGAQ